MLTFIICFAVSAISNWGMAAVACQDFLRQSTLDGLCEAVGDLIENKAINPRRIAVILDLNGTLITSNKQAVPGAASCVERLSKWGVLLVVSSAHKHFNHTLKTLRRLGLSNSLGITGACNADHLEMIVVDAQHQFEGFRCGKVVSMRKSPSLIHKSFLSKAFAVYGAYGKEAMEVDYVFFADDTHANQQIFKQDVDKGALGIHLKYCAVYDIQAE